MITLLTLSIAFYGFNIFRSIFVDIGVSDEGFLINQVNGRSLDGIENWYLPFTDFLAPLWELSEGNLSVYRFLGLIVFFIFLLPSLYLTVTKKQWIVSSIVLVIYAFSGLALSRYLLVTPGYQNLILIASVASVIPLVYVVTQVSGDVFKSKKIMICVLLFLAVNLLIITSGRISGGAAYLGVIGVVFGINLKPRQFFSYFGVIALPTFALFAFDINDWQQRISFSYNIAQIVDPSGYSFFSEVIDIVQPTFPLLIAFITGILLSRQNFQLKVFYVTLLTAICLISIALQINRIGILLLCMIMTLAFRQLGKSYSFILTFSFFVISLIPFWTVFGSNTPAVGNLHFILIGIVLLFVALNKFQSHFSKTHQIQKFQEMLPKFLVLTLVALLYFGIVSENSGYGKSLSDWSLGGHNLNSKSAIMKIKILDDTQVGRQTLRAPRILDLSFFHPGIIYKLGGLQYPVSLSDYKYKSTLKVQLSEIQKYIKESNSERAGYILIKLNESSPHNCQYLSELVEDRELKKELTDKTWVAKYSVEKIVQVRGLDGSFGLAKLCHLR